MLAGPAATKAPMVLVATLISSIYSTDPLAATAVPEVPPPHSARPMVVVPVL